MTLSPDVAQYLKGFGDIVPTPPVPCVVKALIRRQRIAHIKRVKKCGSCKFPPEFSGVVDMNGVWIYIDESNNACFVIHSQFESVISATFESANGTMTSVHDMFHCDESFPDLTRCIGTGLVSLSAKRRWGCWPAFRTAEDARKFYLTNLYLECLNLSSGSQLWYGRGRRNYRCIVCNVPFSNKKDIMAHFSLS